MTPSPHWSAFCTASPVATRAGTRRASRTAPGAATRSANGSSRPRASVAAEAPGQVDVEGVEVDVIQRREDLAEPDRLVSGALDGEVPMCRVGPGAAWMWPCKFTVSAGTRDRGM